MNKALPFLLTVPILGSALSGCDSSGKSSAQAGDVSYPAGFPDTLKNDAYVYYGLGNDKPERMEILDGTGGEPRIGTRTARLDKVEDGKATFVLHQDGGLSGEGDITLSLEPDGLYTVSSTTNKIKPHTLEMPAKMAVGGGWKDHTEMTDQKIVLDNDFKIVGKERVATPGGTYDEALHVTSMGQGTMRGQDVTLTSENWYVRNMGAVKQVLVITPKKGGAPQKITVQLAAPEKPASAAPPVSLPPAPLPVPDASRRPPGAKQ